MKTRTSIASLIFAIMTISIISCSKDDNPFDYLNRSASAPVLHHIVDSIYTPFFTSGEDTLAGYIFWGYENGKLSLSAPNGVLLKNEEPYLLSWENNLDAGVYPITVTAENSKGTTKDNLVLVSSFGGNFVGTYNYHPDSDDGMSKGRPFYFDPDGTLWYHDPWDYGNSIEGNWHWATNSNNEIQGSYKKHGQIGDYLFRATFVYDKDTGLPVLSGQWYETAGAASGKKKGKISFSFDKDSEFTVAYDKENRAWDLASDNQDYPQISDFWDTGDRDKFGGWFIANCTDGPDQKTYRLYLGLDKKIFRGKKNEDETWSWLSDNEIQGTFMEHQDFEGAKEKFITFKGIVSTDWDSIILIKGHWYHGKEVIEGKEAGEIGIYWERRQ